MKGSMRVCGVLAVASALGACLVFSAEQGAGIRNEPVDGTPTAVAVGPHNCLSVAEKEAGWVLLFDGTSTQGWLEVTGGTVPAGSWTVEDGCLKAIAGPGGKQDIRTAGAYRDFECEFEWKLPRNGNAGVKYMLQRIDRWQKQGSSGYEARARGLEYQLVDDACSDAGESTRVTASLYSALAPTGARPMPLGEFNRSRIVVRGEHVEHWLNGVQVLEFTLSRPEVSQVVKACQSGEGPVLRETAIALQNHTPPVWFRNLKIRHLD